MNIQFTRVVADENVPKEVVDHLRGLGFKEVYWIAEHRSGMPDPDVWRLAAAKQAVLLTGDVGIVSQLNKADVMGGPDVIEYSTRGFSKNELSRAEVMTSIVSWIFQLGCHSDYEHIKIHLDGRSRSRAQLWGDENRRRKLTQ